MKYCLDKHMGEIYLQGTKLDYIYPVSILCFNLSGLIVLKDRMLVDGEERKVVSRFINYSREEIQQYWTTMSATTGDSP